MRAARGFLVWTAITLIAIGVLRGAVVSVRLDLHLSSALMVLGGTILVALTWLPIAAVAVWVVATRLAARHRVVLLAVLGVASLFIEPGVTGVMRLVGANIQPYLPRVLARSDTNVLFYIAIVGAVWAAASRRRQIASELAAARLQTALADEQLHVLTLQLHPHFLFNALNLISQLAYESVAAAQRAVSNLQALLVESLRHVIHREVTLGDELRFLSAYLEIQQARFRDRLRVSIAVADDARDAAVPHLVLQPLVENAIMHGLSQRATPGHLTVSARRAATRLIVSVVDDGIGLSRPMSEGMGLTNTRLRLEQLFGADHRLTIAPRYEGGVVVTLDIPYRVNATPSSDDKGSDVAAVEVTPSELTASSALGRVPVWLQVVAGWAAVAVIWTELESATPGASMSGFDWTSTFTAYVINAAFWVFLTPLVVRVGKRFEVGQLPAARALPIHGMLAVAVGLIHFGAWLVTLRLMESREYGPAVQSLFGWLIWDVVAYAAIVAMSTVVAYAARFRDVRVGMARSQSRLASARVAAVRLRLQPTVLLAALDALARVIALDAERSEAAIARIGDLLRLLLARADREMVSVDEELELLEAYLDVVNAPNSDTRALPSLQRRSEIANVADEPIPAMLLPTLGAAMGGAIELLYVEYRDDRLCIAARSSGPRVDQTLLHECAERLRGLYHGRERCSIREASGHTIVELELPIAVADDGTLHLSRARYDLATA